MKNREILKRKSFYFRLLALTSALLFVTLNVFSFFWPSRRFSAAERRNLTQRPEMTYEGLLDGTYGELVEDYLADQYPARDVWVYLNSLQNRMLGIDYQNGIYRGKDGYLIQRFVKPEENKDKQNALVAFLGRHSDINSYVMLVPTAAWIMEDHLPYGAPQDSEKDWYESWIFTSGIANLSSTKVINTADVLSLAAKTKQVYYRTDHHWTTYGASLAFEQLASQMGISYSTEDWKVSTVHTQFQGTMMSSSGFYSGTKDQIDLYLPVASETVLVTNKSEQKTTTTIYSSEGLLGNDPYEVFLGGNFGLINIRTGSQSGRKLLLIKDSYANAMIGFLTPYFTEIDIVDPRYYNNNLEMQMAVSKYTDILVLYNIQNFAKEASLALVLGREVEE